MANHHTRLPTSVPFLQSPMNQATNSRSDKSQMPIQKMDYFKECDAGAERISGQHRRSRETSSRSASVGRSQLSAGPICFAVGRSSTRPRLEPERTRDLNLCGR